MAPRVNTGTVAALSLLVVLLGTGLYWLVGSVVIVEKEVRIAASAEARRNPLLAAERFLRSLGREVQGVSGRDRLLDPPPGDLLLARELWSSMSPEREQRLLEWLAAGGHLVLPAGSGGYDDTAHSGAGFLARLGVAPAPNAACGAPDNEPDPAGGDGQPSAETAETSPVLLHVRGHPGPLKVDFAAGRPLGDASGNAERAAADPSGVRILRYPVGQGSVTVISDTDILHNDRIGEGDHAFLLALLARPGARVWLLHGSRMPSLLSLLWQHQAPLMASALLLAVLGVWYLARWSGPRRVSATAARRNLLEHLEAAAGYHWRTDRGRQLLAGTRSHLEQAWLRRHPVLDTLDPPARYRWIAGHAGLSPQQVEAALRGGARNEAELTRISRLQQRLRQPL